MRITIKISGRWLQSKHFLGKVEFDKIMLFVLDCNQFEVYENDNLLDTFKITNVADKLQWEEDCEYSWIEKRGKPVPLEEFLIEYTSGVGGQMEFAMDVHEDFDITKLKFSKITTHCVLPCCKDTGNVSVLEPAIGYNGKTIFTWQNLENQNVLENADFNTTVKVNYPPELRGKYSTPINTAAGMIFANPERTILSGFTKKVAENLLIPAGIEIISKEAFKGCSNIKSVIFPETLKEISEESFVNCNNLTDVIFLSDIQIDFSKRIFDLDKLQKIAFQKTSRYKIVGDFLLSQDCKILYKVLGKRKICFIPKSVTTIDKNAFIESKVVVLYLPNTVKKIDAIDFGPSITRIFMSKPLINAVKYNLTQNILLSENE